MPIGQVWSTAHADRRAAVDYWVGAICEAFLKMSACSDASDRFSGSLEQHAFGPLALNFIHADQQEVWRTRRDIGRTDENHFYLLHIRRAHLLVRQRGREALVPAGSCVLVDSKEPYYFSFPEGDTCLSVQIPQRWLNTWLPAPEDSVARTWGPDQGGWGAVLAGALGNLRASALAGLALPAPVVADQLAALLALATGAPAPAHSAHKGALLERIRRTLAERFADPVLDPAQVAEQHGISRRYLHLLFADAGSTFGHELMALRLQCGHRLLGDRRFACLPISEVAWRCGFNDPSHFSRRFRQRYGVAPMTHQRPEVASRSVATSIDEKREAQRKSP